MPSRRSSTSQPTASTTYPSYPEGTTTSSRAGTARTGTVRPKTGARIATSIYGGILDQEIICAITESRGISPTIVDNQTYVKTIHKLRVFEPSTILFPSAAVNPIKSKLCSIIEANLSHIPITPFDRKHYGETSGVEFIQNLAFKEDVETTKVSIGGSFFATCCFAASLTYIELELGISFPYHSMRIKYEPSEGSMMIDLSTVQALELIQNLQNPRSKDCLFGLLNQTFTPMGSRLLRCNILQPSANKSVLEKRYDALDELVLKEEIFHATRQALKAFQDVDRVLTDIIIVPARPKVQYFEQSINSVILLKQFIKLVRPVFEALEGATSELLLAIRQLCAPEMIADVDVLIDEAINEDITYQSKPLDLRNQRTYAVKAGVNGLLDVARTSYKEANNDAVQLANELAETYNLSITLKYDSSRQYYFQIPTLDLKDRNVPEIFINVFRRKNYIECQTLDLVKWSQKISDSHVEVLQMSDHVIQELIEKIRADVAPLFRISEGIALLDMIAAFAYSVAIQDYCRPELTSTLAIKDGRHPIREKIQTEKFIPNDVYATQQTRFQIITGCNMSGKSTYIRSISLMAIMAQVGSFVPASYASFPIHHQLFARVSMDDSIESNMSTFAAEMRETAFILRNINPRSLVIIDELGRGTSTRDGLAIAIAIAEALIESKSLVWFVTHFRDLARFLAERPGVVNLHLSVELEHDRMMMLYKIEGGYVQEEHYGIALAKVIDLPPQVIQVAENVSRTLRANDNRQRKTSVILIQARKKKLVLGLKEQLMQAKEGNMQGEVLRRWLKKLQDEFVRRLGALEDELGEREENDSVSATGDDTVGSASSVVREVSVMGDSSTREVGGEDLYTMSGAL